MPVDPRLYEELAKALAQPSKLYQGVTTALDIPHQAIQGYMEGATAGDKLDEFKSNRQTLDEALGGNVPPSLSSYKDLSVRKFRPTAELLTGVGALDKATKEGQPKFGDSLTQDQARKSLVGITGKLEPSDEAFLQSFGTGPIPHSAFSNYQTARAAGTNQTFTGNDENGNPVMVTKRGKMTTGNTPDGGPLFPKSSTMPTTAERNSAGTANVIIPQIDKMSSLIDQAEARGLIGPLSGRVNQQFLAGKIGTTGNAANDELLGKLKAVDTFVKSGAMKVHFGSRGGQQMYDNFSNVLNSSKQSAAQLKGALSGIKSVLTGYSNGGAIGGVRRNSSAPEYQDPSGLTGDPEADAAIEKVLNSGVSPEEKHARISGIRAAASGN